LHCAPLGPLPPADRFPAIDDPATPNRSISEYTTISSTPTALVSRPAGARGGSSL